MLNDFRLAFRSLRRSRNTTLLAILTLGLSLGAATLIAALYSLVAWRLLPVPNAERLTWVHTAHDSEWIGAFGLTSWPDFKTYQEASTLVNLAALRLTGERGLVAEDVLATVSIHEVSYNYFSVLGVEAQRGRAFQSADGVAGAGQVLVLSDRLWRQSFGADPEVVGRQVRLAGEWAEVVGVMPEFGASIAGEKVDLWAALRPPSSAEGWHRDENRAEFVLIGQLAQGHDSAAANAELAAMAQRLDAELPRSKGRRLLTVSPATVTMPIDRKNLGPSLRLMVASVGLLLLIACANVGSLLLSRATERRRETGIRMALGAKRLRLMRFLLAESLLLAALGSCMGLLVARWGEQALAASLGGDFVAALRLDFRVFALGALLCVATAILCTLAPGWSTSRTQPSQVFEHGARSSRGRMRGVGSWLVAAQAALCTVLLVVSGLLLLSLWQLWQSDQGYERDGLLFTRIVSGASTIEEPTQIRRNFEALRRQVETLPGVTAAGLSVIVPPVVMDLTTPVRPAGSGADAEQRVLYNFVDAGYFETLGLSLLEGRAFLGAAEETRPVAIANRAAARLLWPARTSVIGERLVSENRRGWEPGPEFELVGVVEDSAQHDLLSQSEPILYFSYSQRPRPSTVLALRVAISEPLAIAADLRRQVAAVDPGFSMLWLWSADDVRWEYLAEQRVQAQSVGILCAIALLLAVVGVGGSLQTAIGHRRAELGLRMALGARPQDVARLALGSGLLPVAVGCAIAVVLMLSGQRLLIDRLHGVESLNLWILGSASAVMLGLATLAASIPARRASRVDPLVVLRHQ